MGILEDISQLLQKGKSKKVKELVQQAICLLYTSATETKTLGLMILSPVSS